MRTPVALAVLVALAFTGLAPESQARRFVGSNGSAVFRGTPKADQMYAAGGDDVLYGRGGPDRIYGDSGDDLLDGGPGPDRLDGGPGDDRIRSRDRSRDLIFCGPGVDVVIADSRDRVARDCERTVYLLSVRRVGSGVGTVTTSPGGIICGSDCTHEYNAGRTVTLTAVPAPGSRFAGWGGACTGTGSCVVRMSTAHDVSASFVAPRNTLSVQVSGAGGVTSSPAGINCGADCTEILAAGSEVALTAIADPGAVFTGWGGACTGTGACTVTMERSRDVSASFAPTRTLAVSRSAGGTVTSEPAGISCGSICTADIIDGRLVRLTSTPETGLEFSGWSGACSGTGACVLSMSESRAVTAFFVARLTVVRDGNGVGGVSSSPAGISCGPDPSPDCTETYSPGTVVTLTATASPSSTFAGWNGGCSGAALTCDVTMAAATTVTATFTTP